MKVFATRTQTILDILWYLKLITCFSDKDFRQRFSHMFACLKMVFVKITLALRAEFIITSHSFGRI